MKRLILLSLLIFVAIGILIDNKRDSAEQKIDKIHTHEEHARYFANGMKKSKITTCGDSAVVFESGRHVDIPQRHMDLIKKPE